MIYVSNEVVSEVKKLDLFTYLKTYEPNELIHISGNTYCTKTHDSLKISNGMWNWFSRGIGGKTALEFLIKVRGLSFLEAVMFLKEKLEIREPIISENFNEINKNITQKRKIILPEKSESNSKIISYLKQRCIDEEVIKYCLDKQLIYEDLPNHNVVFLGYDENNSVKFACVRATNCSRYMRDVSGSSKEYSFRILGDKTLQQVHLFESAIDLLSYATLLEKDGENFENYNLISLSGVYQTAKNLEQSKCPIVIKKYLESNPNIKEIYIHFDNDIAGKNASKALKILLENKYKIIEDPPKSRKRFQ